MGGGTTGAIGVRVGEGVTTGTVGDVVGVGAVIGAVGAVFSPKILGSPVS